MSIKKPFHTPFRRCSERSREAITIYDNVHHKKLISMPGTMRFRSKEGLLAGFLEDACQIDLYYSILTGANTSRFYQICFSQKV